MISLIIPCYNEALRLDVEAFSLGMKKHPEIQFFFVDDGSSDGTYSILKKIEETHPLQAFAIKLEKNQGKANAIYEGAKKALEHKPEYLGYIDADLAVSIDEFSHLCDVIKAENKKFIFGSRWKRIGSRIDRSLKRHLSGRIFATFASHILRLGVYDTQCGAKVMNADLAEQVFAQPFHVDWVFDVEIFFRILKIYPEPEFSKYCKELPLNEWRDVPGSKVKLSHSVRILKDFRKLQKIYT